PGQSRAADGCGRQAGAVLATPTRLPRHGATHRDSHVELPVLPFTRDHLLSGEIVPFQTASHADAIMVAHIAYPEIEPQPNLPASLSAHIIDGLLRQELGYNGIVVTDALDMDAVDHQFDYAQAAVMAIRAGADMVAAGPGIGLDAQAVMIQAVIDAVRSGDIPESRIHESVRRIVDAKARY